MSNESIRPEGKGVLSRGDLRYLILHFLSEPMHGYQLMKSIGERSGGGYKPSSGAIYPQLKALEEEGIIKYEIVNGRKEYRLTKEGERYLKRNKKIVNDVVQNFMNFWEKNRINEIVASMKSIGDEIMRGILDRSEGSLEKVDKTKRILKKAKEEIREVWEEA